MVSHHSDHSLALRGHSASVVGTTSAGGHGHHRTAQSHVSSRSRRYNRSHAGGGSFVPQNEFPVFSHSGDVEIIVRVPSGHENRYLLHRHTLTRCSGFFEASTSNEWSRATTVPELPPPPTAGAIEGAGNGNGHSNGQLARIDDEAGGNTQSSSTSLGPVKKRWRYELDYGAEGDDIPMLVQKPDDRGDRERGPPPVTNSLFGGPPAPSSSMHSSRRDSKSGFFRSVANLSLSAHHTTPTLPPLTPEEQDILRDYDNLFRIMYNYPPYLESINIADAYIQCKSLLTLADQYDALQVVGPRVDHHLLQFQSRLWKQIAKYPISYLRLGYLARSKVIFQEALVHVVGQWPAGERSIRAALPESVVDIIEDKVDELEETVSRIEARLFRLSLVNSRTGERVAPGNNYLDWLAVSLFRQWLAENTVPVPVPSTPMVTFSADPSSNSTSNNGNSTRPQERNRPNSSRTRGGSSSSSGSALAVRNSQQQQQQQQQPPPPAQPPAVAAPPSVISLGRTYRILGSQSGGGDKSGYLSHDECKRFLKLNPDFYSRDNLRRFEKRIEELKAMAREVVRPLMGSGLELELTGACGEGGVGYLTCVRLGERELPWRDC
ncbi:hypothetical protein QBC38DRAFT_282863 [Podospora fimiseda]|uniref:BTB domain-containing protein n=1 Tax=Podospora fimiseda TaxID=252190 RepID=A0AAN7BKH4_9PEZI|nr:hypothetical protein QBC38DRAFT_282863 [Podospora fimiseda]